MPRRNSIPLRQRVVAVAVNDASVERLRVLPEDERHLRRGPRVSDSKVTPVTRDQGRVEYHRV